MSYKAATKEETIIHYGKLINKLQNENKRYRKALQFYADKENYGERGEYWTIVNDEGKTARKALKGVE